MADDVPPLRQRVFARCPHCGLNVLFDAQGTCPACHVHSTAPVTADDRARIQANIEDAARRAEDEVGPSREERQRRADMRLHGMIAIAVGVGVSLVGFVAARESLHAGSYFIFFGPVLWGARQIARSLDA